MGKLKKHIYDESNGLHYTLEGDYYIPDMKLTEEKTVHRTLWAATPELSQRATSSTVQLPCPERGIVDISC